MQSKTFRLFISSTFSDFAEERSFLHKKIFPRVEKICEDKGYSFQAIDLRWGINSEAQFDQKTLEVCINEVKTCKHFIHPNFLVLAGDRYGYIPCPYMIEKGEFEAIRSEIKNKIDKDLLNEWYQLDENQIPSSYVLQPRFNSDKDSDIWTDKESKLREILQKSAKLIFKDLEQSDEYRKYFLSATEQEVIEGFCAYDKKTDSQKNCNTEIDKSHIFGYFKTDNLAVAHENSSYQKAQKFKSNLKSVLLEKNIIPQNNLELLIEKLESSISSQIENSISINLINQEVSEQLQFKNLKIESFKGRGRSLIFIENYINSGLLKPLILHGPSGMGKTSLIAKSITKSKHKNIVYRFVGATPQSTTIRTLLESIALQLIQKGIVSNIEFDYDDSKFYQQVNELFLSIDRPTVIVIDALDQLHIKEFLQWLPRSLIPGLKIILSVLNDQEYIEDNHYYSILKERDCNFLDILDESLKNTKDELLISLLTKENRVVTNKQKQYVLSQWANSNYSPLWLKIVIVEIKNWKSYDKDQTLEVSVNGAIKEYLNNLSKNYHHNKILIQKVIGYLFSSKYGLSEKELLDILSEDLEDQNLFRDTLLNDFHTPIKKENPRRGCTDELILPISIWSRLHTNLYPFITERLVDGQSLIVFFHRQFHKASEEFISDLTSHHEKLYEYFISLYNISKYINIRPLSEVSHHLYHSNKYNELASIISNLEFVGASFDNKKEMDFKEYLNKISEYNKKTKFFNKFYTENNHLITYKNDAEWSSSQSLFQLAYENGENSLISQKFDNNTYKKSTSWLRNNSRPKVFENSDLIHTSFGHNGSINDAIKLKNGDLVTCSIDKTLKMWDKNGIVQKLFIGHTKAVTGVLELEGNRLLSYSADNSIKIWSHDGLHKEVKASHTLNSHDSVINGILIMGKIFSSFDNDGKIILWDCHGEIVKEIDAHKKRVNGILKYDERHILSYSNDLTMKLWNINDLSSIPVVFKGHKRRIRGVIKLGNGNIVSYGYDYKIYLWNSSGLLLKTLVGHEDMIWGVEELPNNKLYSFSDDMKVCTWNLDTNLKTLSPDIHKLHSKYIWGVLKLKGESGDILSYSDDKTLKLFNVNNERPVEFKGHAKTVKGAIEIGNCIASFSSDNTIRLWNKKGQELKRYTGHKSEICGLIRLSDNRFSSYSIDGNLRIWVVDEDADSTKTCDHLDKINGVVNFKKDLLITYSEDCTLGIWNKYGRRETVLNKHSDYILGVLPLADNKILSFSADNTIKVWMPNGKLYRDIRLAKKKPLVQKNHDSRNTYNFGRDEYILCAIQSKNDKYVYGCTYDDNFFVYDIINNTHNTISVNPKSYDNKFHVKKSNILYNKQTIVGEIHDRIFGIQKLKNNKVLIFPKTGKRKIFNLKNGESREFKPASSETTRGILEFKNGNFLTYSASSGMEIRNRNNFKVIAAMERHTDSIWGAKIKIINGSEKVFSYSFDKTMRIWSDSGVEESVQEIDRGPASGVLELKNGNMLFYLLNNTIHLYNKIDKSIKYIGGHEDFINGLIQIDKNLVISYSDDCAISLWNVERSIELETWRVDSEILGANRIAHNQIILYSKNGEMFSLKDDKLKIISNGHNKQVNGILKLEGDKIASYSNDGLIKVWSVNLFNIELFCTIKAESRQPIVNLISIDNKIYAYSSDKTLRIWHFVNKKYKLFKSIYFARNQANFMNIIDNRFIVCDDNKLLSYNLIE